MTVVKYQVRNGLFHPISCVSDLYSLKNCDTKRDLAGYPPGKGFFNGTACNSTDRYQYHRRLCSDDLPEGTVVEYNWTKNEYQFDQVVLYENQDYGDDS